MFRLLIYLQSAHSQEKSLPKEAMGHILFYLVIPSHQIIDWAIFVLLGGTLPPNHVSSIANMCHSSKVILSGFCSISSLPCQTGLSATSSRTRNISLCHPCPKNRSSWNFLSWGGPENSKAATVTAPDFWLYRWWNGCINFSLPNNPRIYTNNKKLITT